MDLNTYLHIHGILHKEFAKRLETSNNTLSQILNKKRNPSLPLAMRIAYETKGEVPLYELLTREERLALDKKYHAIKLWPDNSSE